jgi:hypothetical protein
LIPTNLYTGRRYTMPAVHWLWLYETHICGRPRQAVLKLCS